MTLLFLDAEMTGLTQQDELISLALVSRLRGNDQRYFYMESTGFQPGRCSDWVHENVVSRLVFVNEEATEQYA